jgi:hypothetical protein
MRSPYDEPVQDRGRVPSPAIRPLIALVAAAAIVFGIAYLGESPEPQGPSPNSGDSQRSPSRAPVLHGSPTSPEEPPHIAGDSPDEADAPAVIRLVRPDGAPGAGFAVEYTPYESLGTFHGQTDVEGSLLIDALASNRLATIRVPQTEGTAEARLTAWLSSSVLVHLQEGCEVVLVLPEEGQAFVGAKCSLEGATGQSTVVLTGRETNAGRWPPGLLRVVALGSSPIRPSSSSTFALPPSGTARLLLPVASAGLAKLRVRVQGMTGEAARAFSCPTEAADAPTAVGRRLPEDPSVWEFLVYRTDQDVILTDGKRWVSGRVPREQLDQIVKISDEPRPGCSVVLRTDSDLESATVEAFLLPPGTLAGLPRDYESTVPGVLRLDRAFALPTGRRWPIDPIQGLRELTWSGLPHGQVLLVRLVHDSHVEQTVDLELPSRAEEIERFVPAPTLIHVHLTRSGESLPVRLTAYRADGRLAVQEPLATGMGSRNQAVLAGTHMPGRLRLTAESGQHAGEVVFDVTDGRVDLVMLPLELAEYSAQAIAPDGSVVAGVALGFASPQHPTVLARTGADGVARAALESTRDLVVATASDPQIFSQNVVLEAGRLGRLHVRRTGSIRLVNQGPDVGVRIHVSSPGLPFRDISALLLGGGQIDVQLLPEGEYSCEVRDAADDDVLLSKTVRVEPGRTQVERLSR